MAASSSAPLSLSLDTLLTHHHHLSSSTSSTSSHSRPLLPKFLHTSLPKGPKPHHPFLSIHTPSPTTTHFLPPSPSLPPTTDSYPTTPPSTGAFLDPDAVEKLNILRNFLYKHEFDHGSLEVRLMADEEVDITVQILAESFAESMWMTGRYLPLLAFVVKQYVLGKRNSLPHAATLVGLYRKKGEEEKQQLVATSEISFDALGANASPPTPLPPTDYPYICNMTVRKELRRKGIGSHLLKACEMLVSQMSQKQKIYLHCRLVDRGPFKMYKKAGYHIVKTDNVLVWLSFQRRKNLMCKRTLSGGLEL